MRITKDNPFVKIFEQNKSLLNEIEVQELITRATTQSKYISELLKENQKLKDIVYIATIGKN